MLILLLTLSGMLWVSSHSMAMEAERTTGMAKAYQIVNDENLTPLQQVFLIHQEAARHNEAMHQQRMKRLQEEKERQRIYEEEQKEVRIAPFLVHLQKEMQDDLARVVLDTAPLKLKRAMEFLSGSHSRLNRYYEPLYVFSGRKGSGREAAAFALAHELERDCIKVVIPDLLEKHKAETPTIIGQLFLKLHHHERKSLLLCQGLEYLDWYNPTTFNQMVKLFQEMKEGVRTNDTVIPIWTVEDIDMLKKEARNVVAPYCIDFEDYEGSREERDLKIICFHLKKMGFIFKKEDVPACLFYYYWQLRGGGSLKKLLERTVSKLSSSHIAYSDFCSSCDEVEAELRSTWGIKEWAYRVGLLSFVGGVMVVGGIVIIPLVIAGVLGKEAKENYEKFMKDASLPITEENQLIEKK